MNQTFITLETPPGQGGLAVLVLEGPKANALLHQCTRSNRLPIPSKDGQVRLMTLGMGQEVLDEVLIAQVKNSVDQSIYEIGIHGGPAVVEEVLALFQSVGATLRRNAQSNALRPQTSSLEAEALSLLPEAHTEAASRILLQALNGELRASIREIQKQIQENQLEKGKAQIARLLHDYSWIKGLFQPPRLAFLGPPNAGKSTLFNALIGEDRAITSDIAGTTRDYIEEVALFHGYPVLLIDTAGLRETEDHIEEQGIEYGLKSAKKADLRLYLRDASDQGIHEIEAIEPCFFLWTKSDVLPSSEDALGEREMRISAKSGEGLETLKSRLRALLFPGSPVSPENPGIFSERQRDLAQRSLEALEDGEKERGQLLLSQLLDDFGKLSQN